ncbi:MAG: ComF family protein [Acidobacteriota bacterium]|nr:MAG: ComF family protein [Acidobacteriota bacterium]
MLDALQDQRQDVPRVVPRDGAGESASCRPASWLGCLAALLLPGPCPCCGADLPAEIVAGVCPGCWASLPLVRGRRCRRCDLPLAEGRETLCFDCGRHGRPPSWERLVAAFDYRGHLVTLHRRYKFGGAIELSRPLARRMALCWQARGLFAPELIVPVPPDPLRWGSRRGSATRLGREVARWLDVPYARWGLVKPRPSRSQTRRPASERRRALVGRYRARKRVVRDRDLLIVDDVATTGATLREAARAALAAGARRVAGLVLARTPSPS